jgi:hypothetical protein
VRRYPGSKQRGTLPEEGALTLTGLPRGSCTLTPSRGAIGVVRNGGAGEGLPARTPDLISTVTGLRRCGVLAPLLGPVRVIRACPEDPYCYRTAESRRYDMNNIFNASATKFS